MSFASLIISWIIALPLGTLVSETRPGGLFPSKVANFILNRLIDIGRAIPFVLLVVFLFPVTRFIIGTSIGTAAMIVPLTICAIPFEARLVEEVLSEIPSNIIEASKLDGANPIQIMVTIEWGAKVPYIINSIGISLINIIGYSAMAGIVGGGGIGNYAIVYGFQRFDWVLIAKSVALVVGLVFIIQFINDILVRYTLRRILCKKH